MDLDPAAHRSLVEAFRARREARYRSPEGWLTLVERVELDPGANRLAIGTLELIPGAPPRLFPAPGVTRAGAPVLGEIALALDDAPTFELDGRRYQVARWREGGVVRVRDPRAPALAGFRRSGKIEVAYAGLRYGIAAKPNERMGIERFFSACEGGKA